MVSRKRLHRLGTIVAEQATTVRARVLAQFLLLVAIVFVVLRARFLWRGSSIEFGSVGWGALAGSFTLAALATAACAPIWLTILKTLGVRTRRRWAWLYFQAQLGKYIPGSVWQYAGRATVSRVHGIPMRQVAVSLPVEFTGLAAAAGSMATFLLGWWGAAVIAGVAILLVTVARLTRFGGTAVSVSLRATLLYLPVWLVLGASFWLCAKGLLAVPVRDLALYTGVFAVAWLAGLVAVYAPGGLGVREAVLVALLSSRLGAADAIVLAAASRLILIVVDVVLAGAATLALRRGTPPLDVADPA